MRTLYLDCFSGISGDMLLGALIDLGVSLEELSLRLKSLNLTDYDLAAAKTIKNGISGTKFSVLISQSEHGHGHRHLPHIIEIIDTSDLPQRVKDLSCKVFTNLAAAEAKIHGISMEKVHFHEVGAIDSIIDIVGAITALDMLRVEEILCSPLPLGSGFVKCAHGTLPLPAPAAMELLTGVPTTSCSIEGETVTPTGAALAKTLASGFGPLPSMNIFKIGYGAGEADREIPNLLRAVLGDTKAVSDTTSFENDSVNLVEANIDDMNPEFYEHVVSRLFSSGAVDVWLNPVIMKKGRPGQVIACLATEDKTAPLVNLLLSETTTLGVRVSSYKRYKLLREIITVQTCYGSINIKLGKNPVNGEILNIAPEWEDCRTKALEHGIPVKLVYDSAKSAFNMK